jgi:hypothetical protein
MVTLPNLGLTAWNLTTDPYDSGQLATNWKKVDEHDHTSGKGLPITTAAIADGAITAAKLASGINPGDNSVTTAKIADGAVTLAKINADAKADWEYAYSTYRDVVERWGGHNGNPTGTRVLHVDGANADVVKTLGSSGNTYAIYAFYLDPDDYTAGSRTNKYRIRAQCFVNGTAPATNFTVELHPVTGWIQATSSGNPVVINTVGAAVSGSSVTFTTPGINAQTEQVSSDFIAPDAGWYVLAETPAASPANGSHTSFRAVLQRRQT